CDSAQLRCAASTLGWSLLALGVKSPYHSLTPFQIHAPRQANSTVTSTPLTPAAQQQLPAQQLPAPAQHSITSSMKSAQQQQQRISAQLSELSLFFQGRSKGVQFPPPVKLPAGREN